MSTAGRGDPSRGSGGQSPTYTLQDLTRRINNIIRIGTVIDCDYDNNKVRVTIGAEGREQITAWINWGSSYASHDLTSNAPELHEQVVLLSMSGRLESAIIVCSLRQAMHPHTTNDPNHKLDLFRILEGTDYWFAKEERKFVGDVNPEAKKANNALPLQTNPPQDKVLNSTTETAEGVEYYYRNIIRPELAALIEHVAIVTQPNGEADLKLVANAMNDGTTKFLLESAVKGDGHAFGYTRVISGASSYDEPTNPHKPVELSRAEGNAINTKEVIVESGTGEVQDNSNILNKGTGGTTIDETIATNDGSINESRTRTSTGGDSNVTDSILSNQKAVKTITISGDSESELVINLTGTSHVRINVGDEGQYVDFDGANVKLVTPNNVTVEAGATALIDCADAHVKASGNAKVSGASCDVEASGAATVKGSTVSVEATGIATLKGAAVTVEAAGALILKGSSVAVVQG